jgi:hypothetical protein
VFGQGAVGTIVLLVLLFPPQYWFKLTSISGQMLSTVRYWNVFDMRNRLFLSSLLLTLMLQSAVVRSQQLIIQADTGKQTQLTRADVEALPRVKVTGGGSGRSAIFEGASLKAVLERGGVEFGEALKGKRLASCLLVEAADGYRVVIALPEIDTAFTDKQTVLAFLKDGSPLDDKEGPYRIVIPDEKRMARWVRQVTALKIVNVQ